ncbi:MAG: adenosine deaminase [Deltaproteobacteria bacterium]|nr:MAG: adenosine deaminase [Deltaproteobacteria bacterium]
MRDQAPQSGIVFDVVPLHSKAPMHDLPDSQRHAFLQQMPKAELHLHLDGSARAETLIEIARAEGRAIPTHDPVELARLLHPGPGVSTLRDYLRAFDITVPLMQSEEAIERIAHELIEDCAMENHLYVEVRYAPVFLTAGGLTMEQAVRAVGRGLDRASTAFGVRTRQILCAMRHLPSSEGEAVVDLAARIGDDVGVGAVDLAGAEAEFPAELHRSTFDRARAAGVPRTVHAGEAAGSESVRVALTTLHAQRLGHGTALREDAALREAVREEGVVVEVCPTSNVQTGAVPSIEDHPAAAFLREGLRVAVCTDNRTVSATTLAREFDLLIRSHRLRLDEVRQLTANAFEGAFLPDAEREALVSRALAAFDDLVAACGLSSSR